MGDDTEMRMLGEILAKLNAQQRPFRDLGLGLRLYFVESGWETAMIKASSGLSVANTLLELDRALRDTRGSIVYIPLGSLLTDDMIERTCRGLAVSKTILKEVKNQA